jgi:S1-C subfamily serine protease
MRKILICAVLLSIAASPAPALLPDEENTIKIFKDVSASVVFVTNIAFQQNVFMDVSAVPQGAGSGFIWDKEGHIVTNFHVVNGGNAFLVTLKDHTELEAKLIGVEPRKDIAVLQVTKSLAKMIPIPVGASESLQVGQKAIAIGNPYGLDNTLTTGVVSALGRSIEGIGQVTIHDVIQTDAAINPGNSGGPLIDSDGKLIGMNTMIYSNSGSSAGVGFAVPVSFIKRIVPQLIKYGKTIQPGIGVQILTPGQTAQLLGDVQGVVVRSITPNTPAARAGIEGISRDLRTGRLLLGDIIIGVDDMPIKNYDDLYNALDRSKVGETITLRTYRNGKRSKYRLELINVF